MKKSFRKIIAIAALISVGITACQKDEPLVGRDQFLGTWKVSSNGSVSKNLNWQMTISAGSSSENQILITNFDAQANTTTTGTVSGSGFSIAKQRIGSETVEGSGSYSNGTLTFHYTADDGVEVDDVQATGSK